MYTRNGDQANCLKIKGESSTTEAWNDTMSNGETAKSQLFESHVFRPGRLWCFPYYREEWYRQFCGWLKNVIRRKKKNYSKQLCNHVDINPWGGTYKVAMRRLRRPPQVSYPRLLKKGCCHSGFSLPNHREKGRGGQLNYCMVPPVIEDELWRICGRNGDIRIPGLGGILTEFSMWIWRLNRPASQTQ